MTPPPKPTPPPNIRFKSAGCAVLVVALLAASCGLAAWGQQNQEVKIDTLKALRLRDASPTSMFVLAADHHGCTEWPYTQVLPTANANKIPFTVYIERGPDNCTGAQMTGARLAEMAASPYIELGTHGWYDLTAGVQRDHFSFNDIKKSFGFVRTNASATITGTGTEWGASDARELIFIPQVRPTPFLILDAPADARTLTIEPSTAVATSGASYAIIDAYSVDNGLTATDGSANITCGTCDFAATGEPWISEPIPGGLFGKGSIVVIESATNNPFYVSDVTSATAITLDKNVSCGGACPASLDFAMAIWTEVIYDAISESRDEIEADAGCSGCVKSWGAPVNDNNEMLVPILRRAGIVSGAGINKSKYNLFGYANFRLFDRHAWDARTGPQGARNILMSAAESDGVLVTNIEGIWAADYKIGTVSLTSGIDTVDCAGGCNWTALAAGSCATATDCWLYVENSTEAKAYRIASFTDSDTLVLDPADTGTDVNSTPGVNVSNSPYFISNIVTPFTQTGCRQAPGGTCLGMPTEMLELVMEWLDANRSKVMAVTHSEAALRHARYSASLTNAFNMIGNPMFRVARAEILPPDNLSATVVDTIVGWEINWIAAPDSGTTLTATADGSLNLTTSTGTPRIALTQQLPYIQPDRRYTFGVFMDPAGASTLSELQTYIEVGERMDSDPSGLAGYAMPPSATTYAAGAPGGFAFREFAINNPGLMMATFDCDTGTCNEATNVMAPNPLQAAAPTNASPDPFVISRGSAGVYTVTYNPTSYTNPMAWVQAQTDSRYCSTDNPGVTSVVVRCRNDAGVAADADFRLQLFDPSVKNIGEQLELQLQAQAIGTVKFAMPTMSEGIYRGRN